MTTYIVGTGGDYATLGAITWGGAGVVAGDLVDLLPETFVERLDVAAAGTAGNEITIDATGAVIDAESTRAICLNIDGYDYVVVLGGEWANSTGDGITFDTAGTDPSTGVLLSQTNVSSAANDGYQIGKAGAGDSASWRLFGVSAVGCSNFGITCVEAPGVVIDWPLVSGCGTAGANNHDGIGVNDGCAGAVVRNFTVINQASDSGSGVDPQDSTGGAAITVEMGRVRSPTNNCYKIAGGASGTPVNMRGIVGVGGNNGCIVTNESANTMSQISLYGATVYGLRVGTSTADGQLTLKNSIIWPDSGLSAAVLRVENSAGSDMSSDYNCLRDINFNWKGTAGNFATWQTAGSQDANSITSDPKFRDAANNDLRVEGNSPCIAAGEDDGQVRQGEDGLRFCSPPSMGAYEVRPGRSGYARNAGAMPARVLPAGADVAKARAA